MGYNILDNALKIWYNIAAGQPELDRQKNRRLAMKHKKSATVMYHVAKLMAVIILAIMLIGGAVAMPYLGNLLYGIGMGVFTGIFVIPVMTAWFVACVREMYRH